MFSGGVGLAQNQSIKRNKHYKHVDIKFCAFDTFLKSPSLGTFNVKRLETKKII